MPSFRPIYSLSRVELEVLQKQINKNLSKGQIRVSQSPARALILFIKKASRELRLYINYRSLNEGTIKNQYPLPLIQETLDQLSRAQYYITLDIRDAYNLIQVAAGEEQKTAFRTRYSLFETLVMPFGLTNTLASFQYFINNILRLFLDQFYIAYLDDILIYSPSLGEY